MVEDFGQGQWGDAWSPELWALYRRWAHEVYFIEWRSLSTKEPLKPHAICAERQTGMSDLATLAAAIWVAGMQGTVGVSSG